MMEIYELCMSQNIKSPIIPILRGIDAPIIQVSELDDFSLGYYEKHYKEQTELLVSPVFMVSEKMKKIMQLYEAEIYWKGVQLFAIEDHTPLLYYAADVPKVKCLHNSVRVNPNGTINEVVLDSKSLPDKDIFAIDGLVETRIMISLRVAESLLRRDIYGLGLKKVGIQ